MNAGAFSHAPLLTLHSPSLISWLRHWLDPSRSFAPSTSLHFWRLGSIIRQCRPSIHAHHTRHHPLHLRRIATATPDQTPQWNPHGLREPRRAHRCIPWPIWILERTRYLHRFGSFRTFAGRCRPMTATTPSCRRASWILINKWPPFFEVHFSCHKPMHTISISCPHHNPAGNLQRFCAGCAYRCITFPIGIFKWIRKQRHHHSFVGFCMR